MWCVRPDRQSRHESLSATRTSVEIATTARSRLRARGCSAIRHVLPSRKARPHCKRNGCHTAAIAQIQGDLEFIGEHELSKSAQPLSVLLRPPRIQLSLNFEKDVAEMETLGRGPISQSVRSKKLSAQFPCAWPARAWPRVPCRLVSSRRAVNRTVHGSSNVTSHSARILPHTQRALLLAKAEAGGRRT